MLHRNIFASSEIMKLIVYIVFLDFVQ